MNPTNPLLKSRVARSGACALGALVLGLAGCATQVTDSAWVETAPTSIVAARPVHGTVERIEALQTHLEPTGGGAVLGGLLGGVVGNRFGGGLGRVAATAIGAVGGAVVGNQIEHREAAAGSTTDYRVQVRLDDGRRRSVDVHDLNGLEVGERVRISNGVLTPS